jgi:hypothetical protein
VPFQNIVGDSLAGLAHQFNHPLGVPSETQIRRQIRL